METEIRKSVDSDVEGSSPDGAPPSKNLSSSDSPISSSRDYSLPCAATDSAEESPYNVFRDSPLRYMGYANEIGESFRYQFPRFVVPSYVLSFGYCGMDAATNGYRVWAGSSSSSIDEQGVASCATEKRAALATFDTLLWQSLASVMIPGATINIIVRAARFGVARIPMSLPAAVTKWFPTCAGIGSIPVIIHPIDNAVDYALDNTTRVWFKDVA